MVVTLVIILPSPHIGGYLIVQLLMAVSILLVFLMSLNHPIIEGSRPYKLVMKRMHVYLLMRKSSFAQKFFKKVNELYYKILII